LIAEQPEKQPPHKRADEPRHRWLRPLVSLVLLGLAVWLLGREISLAEFATALRTARLGFIILGLLLILLTAAAKAWRWQLLFTPDRAPPALGDLFWSMMLGQYLNLFLWRVGDVARVVDLGRRAQRSKAEILSTLVVEKTVDLLLLLVTLGVALPFVVLPDMLRSPGIALAVSALPIALTLYIVSFRNAWILRLSRRAAAWLPLPLADRLLRVVAAGLEGLAALRGGSNAPRLLLATTTVGLLYVATPWVLLPAFDLPFGLREAVLLHLVTSIGSVPPSTPARIGVFEWLVVFLLTQLAGASSPQFLSFAIAYHTVVLLPQAGIGAFAAVRRRRRQPLHVS
jgi:hypothetical protein